MALVLGGFIFENYAIPEMVPLGGEHRFVTHKLIGGARILDAMGRDDCDLSWSGRLQGQDAVQKAMALDQLRISGAQVPLILDSQYYQVGVHKFEWRYERWYQITYTITCIVVTGDGAATIFSSLDSLVSGDLAAAGSLVSSFASGAF